jgi:uncharacterized CHY-type Zn-finger protein
MFINQKVYKPFIPLLNMNENKTGDDLNPLSHNKKGFKIQEIKYSYKIEDYGNNLLCFVICKNGIEIFHSNGYNNIEDLKEEAQRYITDEEMFNSITQDDIKELKLICPECSEELIYDSNIDEVVCLNCGYFGHKNINLINKQIQEIEQENKLFNEEQTDFYVNCNKCKKEVNYLELNKLELKEFDKYKEFTCSDCVNKEIQEEANENLSNILARQKQKERGFKIE